jgi:hypothetical protein
MLLQQITSPTIQKDEQEQPERSGQIPPRHVQQPVLTCEQAGIANNEQVENRKYLQWQQVLFVELIFRISTLTFRCTSLFKM